MRTVEDWMRDRQKHKTDKGREAIKMLLNIKNRNNLPKRGIKKAGLTPTFNQKSLKTGNIYDDL